MAAHHAPAHSKASPGRLFAIAAAAAVGLPPEVVPESGGLASDYAGLPSHSELSGVTQLTWRAKNRGK